MVSMAQYVRLSSQGQTTTPTFSTCGFLQSVDGIDQSSVSGQGSEGMNDHQDSDNFSYEREWQEIYDLLHELCLRQIVGQHTTYA